MPVLTVSGTPLERGRIIGEVLRQDIRTVLDKTTAAIEQGRGYDAEDYLAAFELYADCNLPSNSQ
jgi:hypothetical protein